MQVVAGSGGHQRIIEEEEDDEIGGLDIDMDKIRGGHDDAEKDGGESSPERDSNLYDTSISQI